MAQKTQDPSLDGLALRRATDEDYPAVYSVLHAAFGEAEGKDTYDLYRLDFQPQRTFVAAEDTALVGAVGANALELTVPGAPADRENPTVQAATVNFAGVLPTHRRRGILRALLERQLEDMAERGAPLAILHAAEGGIYGRFGFAPATRLLGLSVDTAAAALRPPVAPRGRGRVRFLSRAEAETLLPEIYERARRLRPGQVQRPDWMWKRAFHDVEESRSGGGLFFVAHQAPGGEGQAYDGYAIYWVNENWAGNRPRHTASVHEIVDAAPEARRDLWAYLLSLDLVATVVYEGAPLDDPLWWLLLDPRAAAVTHLVDGLHVRLLDVPAALESRRYTGDGRLVLEVRDGFRPASGGVFVLEIQGKEVSCRRAAGEVDLEVETTALAACYLGGESFVSLGEAGMARESTPGALATADGLFGHRPLPWSATVF